MKFNSCTLGVLMAVLTAALIVGCGGSSGNGDSSNRENNGNQPLPVATRAFYMGFTPWLFEASSEAVEITYTRLVNHGDIIKHHLLGGVPWQEALEQTAYHPNVKSEIEGRLSRTPGGTVVFLAIDSLDQSRSTLAPYRGETDNMPLQAEWAARTWSSQEVIDAYINYSVDMINRFQPMYFEYGTEVSELIINDPVAYEDYLVFAEAVYTSVKTLFPYLKVMVSVALKSPGSAEMQQIEANIGSILDYTDILGISVYPYAFFSHADRGDPANLPDDWLTQVNSLADGKPLAISETGWIGEDLQINEFGYAESSDETRQDAYLSELLDHADTMDMAFVIWWTTTDFDVLWNNTLAQDPVAKVWKDIGLYDQNQMPRPGLQTWDEWFAKNRE